MFYCEGKASGQVMSTRLRPLLIRHPHRIGALDIALEYICGHDGVWPATGSEVIDRYLTSGAAV